MNVSTGSLWFTYFLMDRLTPTIPETKLYFFNGPFDSDHPRNEMTFQFTRNEKLCKLNLISFWLLCKFNDFVYA